jgi:hypothetical protein
MAYAQEPRLTVTILKTGPFTRWQEKTRLADESLRQAVAEMQRGLIDVDLGGGLVKKRVARAGAGKSAGYRTLLATNKQDRWIFVYGFAKNERDNIAPQELRALRFLAKTLLALRADALQKAIASGEMIEV